jgi:hypothetical protein
MEYDTNLCISDVRHLENGQTILKDTNNATDNTDRYDYNCGGFALGTFDWYLPYISDDEGEYYEPNEDNMDAVYNARYDHDCGEIDYYEMCNIIADVYIDNMIKFGNVDREISSLKELKEGERAVYFRASESDFHYVRILSDGTYAHKPGSSFIEEMSEEELFSENWSETRWDPYSGRVRILVVKEKLRCA